MDISTNGGNESDTVITKDADKQDANTKVDNTKSDDKVDTQTEEEHKETFKASDLLKKEVEKPTVSDEKRDQDRALQQEKFNLSLKFNLKKVEKALDDEVDLDEALKEIPEHLRGHVKGIVSGEESVKPKEEGLKAESAEEVFERLSAKKEGQKLFEKVVSENNMSQENAQVFAEDVLRREKLGHSLNDAVLDASARLGLTSKESIKEAEHKGLMRGLRAAPPEGEPTKKSENTGTYTAQQAEFAKRCGNDPSKVYSNSN